MADIEKWFEKFMAALEKESAERKKAAAEAEAERKKAAAAAESERKKAEAEREKAAAASLEREAKVKAEIDAMQKVLASANRTIGGFTNNYGEALEDEFFAALDEVKRIGDISLDRVECRVKNHYEYDLMGVNCDVVVVGEIKHKVDREDVAHFAEERLPHFAANFPAEAAGRKVLGMIGGDLIAEQAEIEAKKRGFLILRLQNKKLVAKNVKGARPIAQV